METKDLTVLRLQFSEMASGETDPEKKEKYAMDAITIAEQERKNLETIEKLNADKRRETLDKVELALKAAGLSASVAFALAYDWFGNHPCDAAKTLISGLKDFLSFKKRH